VSLRLEILQVSRLAPKVLGDATELVREFVAGQQNPDGGFQDRGGNSDLYYTVFGLDCLIALQREFDRDRLRAFLTGFGDGASLDLIHLTCLARCWAVLGEVPATVREAVRRRLAEHRTPEGGFHLSPGMPRGTVYGAYLACGAHQDLGEKAPDVRDSLLALRSADGAFSNERNLPTGTTTATGGAITLLRQWGAPLPAEVGPWLLSQHHPEGGFFAVPRAPIPDLLSTATALHALAGMQVSFASIKEPCLDFIDTLWDNRGGFHGHWADDHLDVEYTSYALLALGHLSL
jgi:hypothetical protein